jgi:hypothetical protein
MNRIAFGLALVGGVATAAPSQLSTRRDSAEVAVWRVVERGYPGAAVSIVPRKVRWDSLLAPCREVPTPYCGIALDSSFRSAARDMEARNAESIRVAESLLSMTGFQLKDAPPGPDGCRPRARLSLSRVGFDSALSRGIVSYTMSSCGYQTTATFLVRTTEGSAWDIFDTIGRMHAHFSRWPR